MSIDLIREQAIEALPSTPTRPSKASKRTHFSTPSPSSLLKERRGIRQLKRRKAGLLDSYWKSPQKSTSLASKEIQARVSVQQAILALQQAQGVMPQLSKVIAKLQATLRPKASTATTTATTSKPLYSKVLKDAVEGKGEKEGPSAPQDPRNKAQKQGPQDPIQGPKTAQPSLKKPDQVILKLKKEASPPTLNSLKVRNRLNTLMQGIIVSRVQLSTRGNIVVTLTTTTTSREFLDSKEKWMPALEGYEVIGVESPEPYTRLVAHGVFRDLQDPSFDPIRAFKEEVRVFNPYRVKETPRWLKQPREDQRAGSVVFIAPREQEKLILASGLLVFGKRVKVVPYIPYTSKTQCYRCQGFSHDPTTCRAPYCCRVCAKAHPTRAHKCPTCLEGPCKHTTCANCKGDHAANSRDCEVIRALKL